MHKHTSTKRSRKAPHGRAGEVSITTVPPRCELIKLGVDTHAAQYTFARMLDHQGPQPPQKLAPEKFLEFLAKQRTLAQRVVMVYEAGPYGFSLQRQARELGVECLVCAPERLSRGRKRVNDQIDARELLNRLDRYLAGNTAALRLVRVPSVAEEMARRQTRQRGVYLKEVKRWRARGRSLLHTLGISRPGRWWELSRYQQLLQPVEKRYGQKVADQVRSELDGYLRVLMVLEKQLQELTQLLQEAAQEQSENKPTPRVKCVGVLSSAVLDREIGDWNRFSNRRQVASYTGLCPGEDSSGDSQRSLSIDKHGNPRVRAALAECAWLLPRWQPDYRPLQRWKWVFAPGSKAGKALRKKAVVALARHLAVDLWRIKTGRAQAENLGLKLMT